MLIGNKTRFAIEALAESFVDDWVLGRFRFWIGGRAVGNWEDETDLRGCVRWLRELAEVPRDRFDSRLDALDARGVFALVWEPVFGSERTGDPAEQPIADAFARFHVGHLGMSSFETIDMLLLETSGGEERVLWRKAGESDIMEQRLEAGEMEEVAREFSAAFERECLERSRSGTV